MGLLDFLSPALTVATNAYGAEQQGEAHRKQTDISSALQALKMKREQELAAAQTAHLGAETQHVLHQNKAPVLGEDGYADAEGKVAGAKASAEVAPHVQQAVQTAQGTAPIEVKKAVDTARGVAPIHTQEAVNTAWGTVAPHVAQAKAELDLHPMAAVGPDGAPSGTFVKPSEAFGMNKPQAGGAGGLSGSAQNMQARLLGAVSEGRLADQRMDDFVRKHTKNGRLDVGILDQAQANAATNLATSKNLLDIGAQAFSEGHMNKSNPEYMQFMRDARLIARAEQLMSARGGSEAMANDNAFLARGGANAPQATLEAASKSRKALFGRMGAIMQTLTPAQAAKLQAGLDALARDDANFDYAGTGKAVALDGLANPPSAVDQLRAKTAPTTSAPTKTFTYRGKTYQVP